ncbi:putative plasmid stability protein y4jK [Thiocapsa sp. KS1]|jgi:predicted nucleic acid-binding protein|nr:type II toxin-antitoxin system VapC family toxin [Thiocapsa sp. KS1]CRI66862.1 putative plasmid stability protein y4jK [Thiocapsa sp. KS1]
MGLVIDTNVFIDAQNGRFALEHLADFAHYGEGYIAAITVSELLAGVHLAATPTQRVQRAAFVEGLIGSMPVLDFTEAVARVYAELYAHFLRPRGQMKGRVHDLQIAATGIAHGFAVLTSNRDDFKQIPGLRVECPFG